jgi:FixJ family two-component response regulator
MRRLSEPERPREASRIFPSAADFLASPRLVETACLFADGQMPAMTGLEGCAARGLTVPTDVA